MKYQIRIASAADVPAMHLIRSNVQENRLADPARVNEASYLPYIAAGSAWVAETEHGLAGFAILDQPANNVWALFVDPSVEGAGVGRALHRQMLEWAQERGVRRLWLTTSQGTRAERFYRSVGWLQTARAADSEVRFERTSQD